MRPSVRLRRGSALLVFTALLALVAALAGVGRHVSVPHDQRSERTSLSPGGTPVAAPVAFRPDPTPGRAPNPMDLGRLAVPSGVVALLLLVRLLVALPWSGRAAGAEGRLPGRRSPPIALV